MFGFQTFSFGFAWTTIIRLTSGKRPEIVFTSTIENPKKKILSTHTCDGHVNRFGAIAEFVCFHVKTICGKSYEEKKMGVFFFPGGYLSYHIITGSLQFDLVRRTLV